MITELNEENFNEELKTGLKIVEFYARWCGYCHKQDVILHSMEKIWIGKVDADENTVIIGSIEHDPVVYPSSIPKGPLRTVPKTNVLECFELFFY